MLLLEGKDIRCHTDARLIFSPENIEWGNHIWIGPGVMLDGSGGLTIGSHVSFAPNAMVWTHTSALSCVNGTNWADSPDIMRIPVRILDSCYIGAGAIIMPGVYLNCMTVVQAGSVVLRRQYPGNVVLAGNPAKAIMTVSEWKEAHAK